MKIFFKIKTLLLAVLALSACSGEDRTNEFLSLTQHNYWVYETMQHDYLWADALKEPQAKKYFGDPKTFLSNITSSIKNDKWSYLTVDTIKSDPFERGYFNHNESYGMDYMLVTDPTGQTTKQFLRVISVYSNSPAKLAGLQRGDFIMSFNGYKFSNSNVKKLMKGPEVKLKVCHLDVDMEEGLYVWRDTVDCVLGASVKVVDLMDCRLCVHEVGTSKVSYAMLTNMDSKYAGLIRSMTMMDEMVLDLRLCNNGDIESARMIASHIVPAEFHNQVFARSIWSKANEAQNKDYLYDADPATFGLRRVFVITSGYTRGAAEWLIHSLQNTMGKDNVIIIGEKTAGQNVMTQTFRNDAFFISFNPVVAYVADANGNYDYASGITPTYEIRERETHPLCPYGETNEILLSKALELIAAGK